jgi:hypothetical protein
VKTPALPTRLARVLAIGGGLAYIVEGGIVSRAPQGDEHWHASGYTVEGAFVIALLATIPLVPLLATGASKATSVAARLSQLGFTAMLISAAASLAIGGTALGPAFLLGVLSAFVGLIALTVAAIRKRTSNWWRAPLVFAGLVLSMALGDHGGGILFGLAWIGISLAVRDQPQRHAAVPARA